MSDTVARIAGLYRYPVKGLSAEPLESTHLIAGGTLPFDRAYAIENGPSRFDPAAPKHLPKIVFLMLMRNERLASLETRFDDSDGTLTVRRGGEVLASGSLNTDAGRTAIEAFFEDFAADDLRGPARLLSAPGHSFSDAAAKVISLINLQSVRDLESRLGASVDPLRFRGNLHVEGLPPWSEFDWLSRKVAAGGAVFEVVSRIERCAATNVNPETAARDRTIPRDLLEIYGHFDCGVYLKVVEGGTIAVGDSIALA